MPSLTQKDLDNLAWGWTENADSKAINFDQIITSYRLKQNFCKNKTCRRNCRGNPFCLSGLGENRLSENINNPPDDSSLPKRVAGKFVGLKNLGATCYVNSLLQLWFHNKAFRDAIFLWNPLEDPGEKNNNSLNANGPFEPRSVIGHLQQLFALMYHSKCSFIDPTPLVESLRLDPSTQQDAQEFSKLFNSLLEDALSHQSLLQVKNLISNIFRGGYMYVTRCCQCLTESVSPSMFYELELNVKGHNTLTECLAEFLSEEKLEGDDCYSCVTCQSKQEAVRYIKLCTLPPVLNLQLLRFVYDRDKGTRKKLKTVVQFPEILDMKDFVQSSDSLIYNLSAVLIHKGSLAFSGHFIAYIKDNVTGTWNTFNDESVSKLEGKKLQLDEEDSEGTNKTKAPRLPKGFQSSTDAYMLVYTSEKHNPNLTEITLSKRLQEYVDSQNKVFDDLCQDIASNKKEGRDRQERLLNIYNCLPVDETDDLDEIDVLPTEWLTSWMDMKFQQIDTSKLVCPHEKLDPTAVTSAKYVSRNVTDNLYDEFGGGPRLMGADVLCRECVARTCLINYTKHKTLEESREITSILKRRMGVDEPGFYVSKNCLKTWRSRVLNLVQGKGSEENKSYEADNCSNEARTEAVLPLTSSLSENVSKNEKANECTETVKTSPSRSTRSVQRRKSNSTVSVPYSKIRDCVVLCEKLQVSLNKPVQLQKNILLEHCKQLRVQLRRLALSPKSVKALAYKRYLGRKRIENKKRNHSLNSNGRSGLNCNGDNCQPCDNQLVKHDSEYNSKTGVQVKLEERFSNGEHSSHCEDGDDNVKLKTEDEGANSSDDVEPSKEFNEAIRCSHGNLSVEENERKLVPVRVWEILRQYFPSAPEFTHESIPCQLCQNLASKDEVVKQQYYETALNQKRIFSDLISLRNRPQIGKTDDTIFILHKQNFFQPWCAFLRTAVRRDSVVLAEPPVSLKVDSLLCVHGLLHYSTEFEDDLGRMVLVSRQEWEELLTIFIADTAVTIRPDTTTDPELCKSCFEARIESEEKEKLNYERAKLNIRMMQTSTVLEDQDSQGDGAARKRLRLSDGSTSPIPPELKNVIKNVSSATLAGGGDAVRRSARNRKVPGEKNMSLMVSSSLTLRELKQKITSQWAVAPFDQHLFTEAGKELEGDFNTLFSLGILPNSTLLLQVDEAKESFDDVMEECTPRELEVGFKGTGLVLQY